MSPNAIIRLVRIPQYIKNIFIFLPLFFSLEITNTQLLIDCCVAFIAFSISASAIYTLNDYLDIEDDRKHPEKSKRPLASGEISKSQALIIMGVLLLSGFTLMSLLCAKAANVLAIYVLMNIAYCFYLKHIAILDVTTIAIGFVLRLFVGSAVTNIQLSMWIVVMTFLLALFIALAKRRDDFIIYLDTGGKMRKVIDGYNLRFLDGAMVIMASVVIVAYTIYTTSSKASEQANGEYLYLTALFVIVGILRYMQITLVEKDSGSPTRIVLNDRFMQLTLLFWIASFAWIIY